MWSEPTKDNKTKFIERYKDNLSGRTKKVSVTLPGKDTAKNRRIAADILKSRIKDKLATTISKDTAERLTFSNLVTFYLADQAVTVSQGTYRRNYHATNTLKSILGPDTLVSQLSANYVRRCFNDTGDSPNTLNERLARLKAMIKWGYRNDYIEDVSWLDKLTRYDDSERKIKLQDKFLESSELKTLIDAMREPHWKLLTRFLSLSGMRCGEALALEINDLDFEHRIIKIDKTLDPVNYIITDPKTVSSNRDVYMQSELLDCCHEIKKLALSQSILFGYRTKHLWSKHNGSYLDYYAYNKYLKETAIAILGRPVTTHVMRHTHVALMAENGVSLDAISRRLGHENSRITKAVYFHVTEKMKEKDNMEFENVKIL